MTAYDLNGNESAFSAEVQFTCHALNDCGGEEPNALPLFEVVLGDNSYGAAVSVQQTTEGGYITAGYTYSHGSGGADVYLVKLGEDGNVVWDRTFGGAGHDSGNAVLETSDGGYVIAGSTYSYGTGGYDVYLVKTDADGRSQWERTYGGHSYEQAYRSEENTSELN